MHKQRERSVGDYVHGGSTANAMELLYMSAIWLEASKLCDIVIPWRDGSVVKSTDCFSRGPEFQSQQPHDGSQPSVIRSDALFWYVSEDSYSVLTYNNNNK